LERKRNLEPEAAQSPEIFVGRIASGDAVMKSSEHRDQIAREHNVIAFEMEGAGVWDELPCIVIKGICDYADSHKSKVWQPFAAGTAAAVAKAMLERYTPTDQRRSAVHNAELEERNRKYLEDLRTTDPRHDKTRIEQAKGGLLADSYRWVLNNVDFRRWRDDGQSRLLWIKGDPGKGKTMLLCGIIDELKCTYDSSLLSFFFCQATDASINNATAVLRGLIYVLVDQHPSLISHVQKKYDASGNPLFRDVNAWVALSEIFTGILEDQSLPRTHLIIDALDECTRDLDLLLDLVVQTSLAYSNVKWIVSSRNWPSIEKNLDTATQKVRLSLELNEEAVSAAVTAYVQFKVEGLAKRNKYSNDTRDAVQRYLSANAHSTFLWVALVCQELAKTPGWKTQKKLAVFPPGLSALYRRMMDQICNFEDTEDTALCKDILAIVSIVYRPITLDELAALVETLDGVSGNYEALAEIVGLCGSFLALRERTVSFIHQSAKDFLLNQARDEIFPSRIEDIHYNIFSGSLRVMRKTLRRDIYNLGAPGFPINKVKALDPDPLAAARYSCIYWVDHLRDCDPNKNAKDDFRDRDDGSINVFLRQTYLHWLETLSLLKGMSEGTASMLELERLLKVGKKSSLLIHRVRDACRFILYHKWAIENSPLQVYASALVFSPTYSITRNQCENEEPKWIVRKPAMVDNWSACLQTLEGHNSSVRSVAWSHTTRLASASQDNTVKIWDSATGQCVATLKGHSDWVSVVAWSHDATRLASASDDNTVKIWDPATGKCVATLKTGRIAFYLQFHESNAGLLRTELGTFDLGTLAIRTVFGPAATDRSSTIAVGYGLSRSGTWITYQGENLLWLPPEYRPSSSAISGMAMSIGCPSGRVLIFTFSDSNPIS